MMNIDKDLLAIQEVRNLVKKAKEAQRILATFSQEEIDRIVQAMAEEGIKASRWLAKVAVEETEIGKYEDKIIKNLFSTKKVYDSIKNLKTVGIIYEEKEKRVYHIAEPVGVIAALTPTTNPTSTAFFKSLISIKSRNAVIFSPHPRAVDCTCQAAEIMHKAAVHAGAPEGIIGCIHYPTLDATNQLMTHPDISVILATGGSGMVKAAYSSGKPAFGVGPGNVPAYIERSANAKKAVKAIFDSKTFDYGTICSSEQSLICEKLNANEVREAIKEQGGVFLNEEEIHKLERFAFRCDGSLSPAIVGKSAAAIAQSAGFKVDPNTRVLLAELSGVGMEYPLSREKLSPVLAYYEVENWQEACELSKRLLALGGMGHTLSIHSEDKEVITRFALEKPASRIVVNTPSCLGAIGGTTGLTPSLTLGCGSFGGNSTSDNIGPMNLLNIKRLAYEIKSPEELTAELLAAEADGDSEEELVKKIVKEVLKKIS
ncbi:aldehyde dehydrogenase [Tepidanaerobacter syntrophicus]|uniref:acetaldehyde dehydrogenase (acetylating) n=2 Tax=Tepidanaerobacter syntrophicus TaxID=224999 RepID=UPI0022EF3BAE|nr:acetaldehyde dehydrogenase (acetylating) [Tepidanaerobacter syntrophicus]GLI51750.1 aldehyde dehydrogenase [Tepidanaerobacter syntrophicus]